MQGSHELKVAALKGVWRSAFTACGMVVAVACGGGGDGPGVAPPPPPPAAVATVEVAPANATVLTGATTQLTATAKDAAGNTLAGRTISWSSSNTGLATVDNAGLVTGVGAGTATVTATSESRTGSATVVISLPAVASVSLAPATSSVLAGTTVQLTATPRDVAGAALSGRAVVWTTSNAAVASVSPSGLVTTITPGMAVITAAVESRLATASIESVDPAPIPAFVRPFAATAVDRTVNFHDHDIPRSFFDNGRKVTYWGETNDATGYEGHEGYDWRMAEGTPIFVAAEGTVITTSHAAFACPILNSTIPANGNGWMVIEHQLPGGVRVQTGYAHLSRKDVAAGDKVAAGQQIGLSGTQGCSLNPHLHFVVYRLTQTKNGAASVIDSYGWEGAGSDPWLAESDGAASIYLWKPNEAPDLSVRIPFDFNANGGTAYFGLSELQPMGVRDDTHPNNEYLEVARDPNFAPATLSIAGVTIKTKGGTVFTFPSGASLSAANPKIRVYSGTGTSTASELYMGRATPVYNNRIECVEVLNAVGQSRGRTGWGAGCS